MDAYSCGLLVRSFIFPLPALHFGADALLQVHPQALKSVGLSKRHVTQTCQLIAAILHLGNLEFTVDRDRDASQSPLFLGFDLSTQQLKAIVISSDSSVVHESAVHFDSDLPGYGTSNGAIRGPDDGEVTSPIRMCQWLEAIDLVMQRVKSAGVDLSAIAGISGAGQGGAPMIRKEPVTDSTPTIAAYWSEETEKALASMDPQRSLAELGHLAPHAFASQDSSTTQGLAYERFTGPQIARIRRLKPNAYRHSARISLVSSFLPSLFLGSIAPIEISDASGMNLMNVLTCAWDDSLLEACGGPELRAKLGPEPVPGGTVLGKISNWWVERLGFSPDCIIAPFTGDNPATVVALSAPGDALLSLGTSTTLLLSIPPADTPPKRFTTSHLLAHPTTSDAQIAMLCYKNGALAREQIRGRDANHDWEKYNQLVESTPVGNRDAAVVRNVDVLNIVAEFLGVQPSALENALSYKTEMVKELCTVFLDADGASDNRDDLAKTLFHPIRLAKRTCQPASLP
ncbi:hypothetical protein BU15DRAFT_77675 [Melanogaster broomeanus]|nr:hypothetical protein BU15DRAFT_77675 [Melanogaster broomeanus]